MYTRISYEQYYDFNEKPLTLQKHSMFVYSFYLDRFVRSFVWLAGYVPVKQHFPMNFPFGVQSWVDYYCAQPFNAVNFKTFIYTILQTQIPQFSA